MTGLTMDSLLEQLDQKGLRWIAGGLESHSWLVDEDVVEWVMSTSIHFAKGLNEGRLLEFTAVEPKALVLLSQATVRLLGSKEGSVSKDLAIIAQYNAITNAVHNGSVDVTLDHVCRGLINRGRAIDCGIYFQDHTKRDLYDGTFAPDMFELMNEVNQTLELLNAFGEEMPWGSGNEQHLVLMSHLLSSATIHRGLYLQYEMAEHLMTDQQKFEFVEGLRVMSSTINQNLMNSTVGSPISNIVLNGMFAYLFYFWKECGFFQHPLPIEPILSSVERSCSDHEELTPEVSYYTLFAQVLRLRIFSENPEFKEFFPHAVDLAERALERSANINNYDVYERVINSLKSSGTFDKTDFASELFMLW